MHHLTKLTCYLMLCLLSTPITATPHAQSTATDKSHCQYLRMQLKDGPVVIEMRPDLAPHTVQRLCTLAGEKFYDGIIFHRVIAGFMAQTGDPTGTGIGGSGQSLKAEFSRERHLRGTVSMARTQAPNSADSQFFIVLQDAKFLDGKYTIFGQVSSGMGAVDHIKKGDPNQNGMVSPLADKIIDLRPYNTDPSSSSNHQD